MKSLSTATYSTPESTEMLLKARAFAEPLVLGEVLDTGENMLSHADAMAVILKGIGCSETVQAASYLVYACDHLNKPQELITKAFGDNLSALVMETNKLIRIQRQSRLLQLSGSTHTQSTLGVVQTESVRKMLLGFSRDLRVVLLRLVSRLQTLRFFAATKLPLPAGLAAESLQVFAKLANRLGIWEIKWEMEDLAFRFLEPDTYRQVACLLHEKRTEREAHVEHLRSQLEQDLNAHGLHTQVSGRPKHIYSIVKKMRGKSLGFEQVYDLQALRIVVASVPECYGALSWIHSHFTPLPQEFDDYIARPKVNGYQSLHTVVTDATGHPTEIQIRTQAMHDHAENGMAAHWAYKEAGTKGYAGVSAASEYDAKIAVLRQLLAWERDLSGTQPQTQSLLDDRIYVLTPDASVVELPRGATAVDFAYSLHTSLGHRCRGARVDGVMVPMNTALQNGQTVEIIAVKEGGPSRDWLNPDLGYLISHRAKTKVRAWFNALALSETVARGREAVGKLLQREGKTSINQDDLAAQLGFDHANALFEEVGKDEFSLRKIELLLRPPQAPQFDANAPILHRPSAKKTFAKSSLLVEGVDSVMTQLAKCCKPAPPDALCGFVTRGKGVSVHRADCTNVRELVVRHEERLIHVEWGLTQTGEGLVYPVDIAVQAQDRQGLLRDISEVFTKEKMNVTGVQTQSIKGTAWMTFTVEISDSERLHKVLGSVAALSGVYGARRR
jgi:GTP pyrophosphokinase